MFEKGKLKKLVGPKVKKVNYLAIAKTVKCV